MTPEKNETKPIKLYFALLNKGWIRREVASVQIPEMHKTPGVEFVWENPDKTWGHPIYSNRNAIVKRFLATDCDFLMMQDDDIIVNHNPAQLVFADKDIIGCPAKVRTSQGTLDWVAYKYSADLGGFTTIRLAGTSPEVDLLAVDIVGTGLIIIKRKVLEELKAPFLVRNDEDGICEMGTDFAFCDKARRAGFDVYTTPHRICDHIKEVGLLDIGGYEDSDDYDYANAKYKIAWGGWAIQGKDWRFIKDAIEKHKVKRVVEFGAGLSSLLMSESCCVTTFETRKDWADGIAEKGKGNWLETRVWDGVNGPDMSDLKRVDMVFIDGPPAISNGGTGREAAYRATAEFGPRLIITHDSGRREELRWANKYFRGKYEIADKNGNHSTRCQLWKRIAQDAV